MVTATRYIITNGEYLYFKGSIYFGVSKELIEEHNYKEKKKAQSAYNYFKKTNFWDGKCGLYGQKITNLNWQLKPVEIVLSYL